MLAARAVGMRPREPTPEHALRITPRAIALIPLIGLIGLIGLIVRVARFVSIPLAIAIAFAITHGPSIARAREHAAFGDPASDTTVAGGSDAREPGEGVAWRPILAGCLGVFFGAAVAVWQIRGRKKD